MPDNSERLIGRQSKAVPRHTTNPTSSNSHNGQHGISGVSVGLKSRPHSGVAKFCHECGARFPTQQVKFCTECGLKRLQVNLR